MARGRTKEWEGVTGGRGLGQAALLWLFRITNVTVGYVFLALVVPFYMLLGRKGYKASYGYFRKRHGYAPLKAFWKTYLNHFVFGQCMLDRFAVYAGRRNFFKVEIVGGDYFLELLDSEKGFLIASSHVGNFELSGYLLRQDRKRINALVFGGESARIMEERARHFGENNISVIPVVEGDMSHIFAISAAFSEGQIVSMPCDRNLGSPKSVECDFLGAKADFPQGGFNVAAQFDVPVVAIFVMKRSASRYTIYVRPVGEAIPADAPRRQKVEALARSFASQMEEVVRMYPEQWFNFYDFWK